MDEPKKSGSLLLTEAFREVMRNSEDYIFVKDPTLVYWGSSDAFARMAGLRSADELIGKTDFDLFPRDIAEKYRADDRSVLESGTPIEGTVERLPDRDGEKRWTRTWKHAVRDGDRLLGIYGISRDVTREVGLKTEAEAARKYQDLIRGMPGGVGILHEREDDYILDYANSGWTRIHHLDAEAMKRQRGASVMPLVFEEDRPRLREEYRRMRGDREAQGGLTYRVHGGDGRLHWVSVQFRFAYEEGGVRYYYASYTDADEAKEAEEKLADSRRALREAVANSDIQFFTYFPGQARCEIYAVNNRLSELPMVWERFPDDFLAYTEASPADAQAYREMLRRIDAGADQAECTVRFAYHGIYTWERLRIRAVRGEDGKTVRAQGYSLNVTDRRSAEERLRRERVRLKSLEGSTFEAFSFNVSQNSEPEVQTTDQALLRGDVPEEITAEALRISPPIGRIDDRTRDVLLRAAARIPDAEERRLFLETCSGQGMRQALSEGRYGAEIRYRRYVGERLRWVSTRAEVLPDPESGDMIAFYYTTDINDEVIREKLAVRIVGMNYERVSFCDLQSQEMHVVAERGAGVVRPACGYEQALDAVSAAFEPGREREFRERLSLPRLLAELEKGPSCTVYFTLREARDDLPGRPLRQMKDDVFYLDEHRDIVVFLLSEVTEILEHDRANREQMAAALASARQASLAKSNFLSRMSHEIRTPLNAIIGMDTIAAQSLGDRDKVADCISKIGLSARYLLSLINDILDMSRIESGKMLLKNERFLFADFIAGVNNIIYPQARAKGLDYECSVACEIDDAYIGDEMKLQQVLVNVLGNAVKFTEHGRITLDISAVAREGSRSKLRFVVNDTGCGISEKNQARIFEAFEQVDTSTTTVFGGTGLGLAITRNLVGLMGGLVSVRSIVGVGSEFTVDVPLTVDESVVKRPKLDRSLLNLHALIVDDDLFICEQTNAILREIGMIGEWVTNGQEAVERVRGRLSGGRYYDFILIDWKMPDMDGIETTQRIRSLVGPDVTIIIISAYDWQSIESEARAAGANLLISKPLLRTTLISAFEKALGRAEPEEMREPELDFSGRRVLVAEDNELNAEIARTLLENRNFTVETAPNGIRALEMFAQSPAGYYDAILMDVRMPMMDGLQATVNIRHWNKEDAAAIPIVAMTANAFDEDVEKSRAAGMNAHLSKPIDPNLMYSTLYRLIESGQEQKQE